MDEFEENTKTIKGTFIYMKIVSLRIDHNLYDLLMLKKTGKDFIDNARSDSKIRNAEREMKALDFFIKIQMN